VIKVTDLPRGWELWADGDDATPRFRRRGGPWFHYDDVVLRPEGRSVYHEVRRWLAVSDAEHRDAASQLKQRAVDKARLGMELVLRREGKWDDSMLMQATVLNG
jgi:hypothetical protein